MSDPEELRRLLEEILSGCTDQSYPTSFYSIGAASKRPPPEPSVEKVVHTAVAISKKRGMGNIDVVSRGVLFEHWWHLVRLGVIVPGADGCSAFISKRGRAYLERGANSPHHPRRFIAALRARVPVIDELVIAYVDEAVGAWEAQLYRASVVMIGCACEHLVLELARAIGDCTKIRSARKVEARLTGVRPPGISDLFDDVKTAFEELQSTKQLPGAFADTWDRNLAPVFERARGLRNKAGHPTGIAVSAADAEAGLLLLPDFYERMDTLSRHIRQLG